MTNKLCTNFAEFASSNQFWTSESGSKSFNTAFYSSIFGYSAGNGRVFLNNNFSGGFVTKTLPSDDEYYFHFAWVPSDFSTNFPSVMEFQESGTIHGGLAWDSATQTFFLWKGSTATVLVTSGLIPNAAHTFCVRWKVSDTVGVATLWVDGTVACTFSGDTRNGGASGVITTLVCRTVGTSISGPASYYTDFFFNNTDGSENNGFDGAIRILSDVPNANGASGVAMTPSAGSNYQNLDDAIPGFHDSDTTYNETSSYPATDWLAYPTPSVTGTIKFAGVVYYGRATDAGTHTMRSKVKRSGTVIDGITVAVGTTFVRFQDAFPLDPATSAIWASFADLGAAEFGVEAVS